MEKLDLKDRKILYELDKDCRQSFRSIGRKVGLSKDVVSNRVKKLQKNGIIKRFYIRYDPLQFGLNILRFYFKFQYVTPDIKKEIIDHFMNNDYVDTLFSTEGSYDLGVIMNVDKVSDIYPFWKKTLEKYGDYFTQQTFSVYMGESAYGRSFIMDESKAPDITPVKHVMGQVKMDNLDLGIMKLLVNNARIPTLEIAKKLNTNVSTVHERIKKLIDSKVILRFSVELDLDKIGYQIWKVDFYLSEYSKQNQIVKYMEKSPLFFAVDYTIGYADLEFEINVKNINQLHSIIEDLHSKFPRIIRNYTYFRIVKVYKWFTLE